MKRITAVTIVLMWVSAAVWSVGAQAPSDGPRYKGTAIERPADYREWVYLSSGLGMTYEPPGANPAPPTFGNVFVNPSSYRSFMKTGKWPDKTMFVLEFRSSGSEASINKSGRFQTDLTGLEAEVKDARFPDGWAFVNFGSAASTASAEPLSASASARCVDCHSKNTAVERTFVQFYPTLFEVARRMGTVKPGF